MHITPHLCQLVLQLTPHQHRSQKPIADPQVQAHHTSPQSRLEHAQVAEEEGLGSLVGV